MTLRSVSEVRDFTHVLLSDVLHRCTSFSGVRPIHSDWWWARLTACVFISQLYPCITVQLSDDNVSQLPAIINHCLQPHPFVLILVERRAGAESLSPSSCCAFRFLGLPFTSTDSFREASALSPLSSDARFFRFLVFFARSSLQPP